MTRIIGSRILKSPCCGSTLKSEAYASINFSVAENWTDGKMIGTLYNRDGKLRHCICGQVFLLDDAMTDVVILKSDKTLSAESIPSAQYIKDEEVESLLESQEFSPEIEIILRKRLWQISNDSFRDIYRAHKKINPNSFPSYAITTKQTSNLERLKSLINEPNADNALLLIEINRALGNKSDAIKCITSISKEDESFVKMMANLIDSNYRGPARYKS
jgi:hypothetical protein